MSALPWVLLGLGAFSFFYVRDLERKQATSRGWLSATGRLVHVRSRQLSGNADDDELIPLVVYEYRVAGKRHLGSEIDFSGRNSVPPEDFDRIMAGLAQGARVPVYYDPHDPRRCVLRPGRPTGRDAEELGEMALGGFALGMLGAIVLAVELFSGLPFFDALRSWLP